jgi:E3 ubiquitin-protein ligase UBR1
VRFYFPVAGMRQLKTDFTRRGRRQYLHFSRWEEVRKTWLAHGIPTIIARRLESSLDSGGWETL